MTNLLILLSTGFFILALLRTPNLSTRAKSTSISYKSCAEDSSIPSPFGGNFKLILGLAFGQAMCLTTCLNV